MDKEFSFIEDKKVMLKNNEPIVLKLYYNDIYKYYEIRAYDKDKDIGFTNFKFETNGNSVWLQNIQVTDDNFLSKGVGKAMLKMFENVCTNARRFHVEGKFYPKGNGAHLTRDFYNRNGYSIYKDDYETYIDKTLPREK